MALTVSSGKAIVAQIVAGNPTKSSVKLLVVVDVGFLPDLVSNNPTTSGGAVDSDMALPQR